MSTNCIDCTEVYYMYQLDDELRCDECNEYRCGKCDSLTILSRAVDDRDEPVSCVCGFESTRIYNAPGIQFKGTGFYKTGG
jgi:putative FmdB family regulatory protein